jgi:hypothetical protein
MRIVNRYLTYEHNKKLLLLLERLSIPFNEEKRSFGEGNDLYILEFILYEDDINFEEKSKQVQKFKLTPQIGTTFSQEDEENAEWFRMSTGQFGYPQPEEDYFKITYTPENVCPQCEIGKRQINPFRFKTEPKAKHSQFLGLNWVFDEIFLREEAVKLLTRQNITGLRFSNPIIHKTKIPIETLHQIHVDTILPEGLLTSNLTFEICEKPTDKKQIAFIKKQNPGYLDLRFCGRKKYNFPVKGMMTFRREIFEKQPDFVKPFEWFGSGGSSSRPILVSQRVRQLIIKNKLRGAFFTPIALV